MFTYVLTSFFIASTTAYSVPDGNHQVVESDAHELRWADTYTVKATRFSLISNIVEDYTAWKTNESSRVDYNNGAVKVITNFESKFQIFPETTEDVLNEIVCHVVSEELLGDAIQLDEILPDVTSEYYEARGNEYVGEIYATKFEYHYEDRKEEYRKTLWAAYDDNHGWIPVKHELKQYNALLGSLVQHSICTYFNYDPEFDEEDVFDTEQFGCDEESAVKHTADSDKITKELLFVNVNNKKHSDHVFNHFKNKFNRTYAHEKEHALRKSIFDENIRMISSVNRRNLTYKLGINKFTDWTPEEIKRNKGAFRRPERRVGTVAFPYKESDLDDVIEKMPKEYDLRMFGLISPVKDQGTCGSCWTFGATAVTESGLARVNGGKVLSLSSQAIVDCAYLEIGGIGGGCNGGTDYEAYDFIMKHGLPTEQEYGPYKNQNGFCNIGNMTKTYRISGYTNVTPFNFNALKVAVVNHGPVFVFVHASDEFFAYSSGVFYQSNKKCDPEAVDHVVTLVGYGEKYGELFWILKNSWGESWGVDGYMMIAAKDNVCGIPLQPSYPVF